VENYLDVSLSLRYHSRCIDIFTEPGWAEKEKVMNKKVTSIFAYLGIIFWLIGFLAGDKENAKFHLNQGLVLAIGQIICSVLSAIPIVGLIACIVSIVLLVFQIMGIVYACQDQDKELPLIGKINLLK
jgi:uncharacterized membrane protein